MSASSSPNKEKGGGERENLQNKNEEKEIDDHHQHKASLLPPNERISTQHLSLSESILELESGSAGWKADRLFFQKERNGLFMSPLRHDVMSDSAWYIFSLNVVIIIVRISLSRLLSLVQQRQKWYFLLGQAEKVERDNRLKEKGEDENFRKLLSLTLSLLSLSFSLSV